MDRKFQGERVKAFDSHMQMVSGGKIVASNIIQANHSLKESEVTFGKKGLDGKPGKV